MIAPGLYGDMFVLVPIYAGAVLLGLVSGVVAVHLAMRRKGRLSIRALMGVVVLAALGCALLAAMPSYWVPTASFWAMAATIMALTDLAVIGLVELGRPDRRISERSARLLVARLPLATAAAVAGAVLILKWGFDIPINTDLVLPFAGKMVLAVLALATLDLAARLAALALGLWRRRARAAG